MYPSRATPRARSRSIGTSTPAIGIVRACRVLLTSPRTVIVFASKSRSRGWRFAASPRRIAVSTRTRTRSLNAASIRRVRQQRLDFVVAQHALARLLFHRFLHAVDRDRGHDVAVAQPSEPMPDLRLRPVSGDRPPARLNFVEAQQELAARQRSDRTRVERLERLSQRDHPVASRRLPRCGRDDGGFIPIEGVGDGHDGRVRLLSRFEVRLRLRAGQRPCATAARCCFPIARASASDSEPRPIAWFCL